MVLCDRLAERELLRSTRLTAVVTATLIASLIVPAIGDFGIANVAAAENDGYVRVGWLSTIVNWNPLAIEMVEDYVACYLIHSSLWTYDQDWNGPVNDLATGYSFDVHPNGSMTTTITITDTAYFRNAANIDDTSHPLTADDVAFSLNLMKANEGGAFDWYLQEVGDIQVVDEYTISLWTPYQKATLIDDLTSLPIVPRYVWQDNLNPLANMKPEELVGSGPFVYESMLKDAWYKFKRAPNYHGAADYPGVRDVDEGLNGIIYTVYSDMPGLATAMNSGDEDTVVVTGSFPTFVDSLGGSSASVNVIKAAVQENGICDIAVNAIPEVFRTPTYGTGNPLLLDPIVRKAIMMTLDKDYINETLLRGLGTLGDSVVDPGFWHKTIDNELPFDPAAASTLLDTNGWDMGPNGYYVATAEAYGVQMDFFEAGTELSGIRCQAPDTDPTYGYIVIDWQGKAEDAGIGLVSTVESEITMINQAWYKADYDIWVWHWGWDPEPLSGALRCWLTSEIGAGGDNCQMPMGPWWYGPDNYTNAPEEWGLTGAYSSFDQNMSTAMHTLDRDARKVIVDELQQMIYDSYCENPPYYDLGLYAYTDYRFVNWGDWAAHPGRTISSGLLWTWFDLTPTGAYMPRIDVPLEGTYEVLRLDETTFSVTVSDPNGDPLNVTWLFGDGTVSSEMITVNTTTPVEVSCSHAYLELSSFELTVRVSDGTAAPSNYTATTVTVIHETDDGPMISSPAPIPYPFGYILEPVQWTVSAADNESGGSDGYGLSVWWDWGDGTNSATHLQPTENGTVITIMENHTWASTGSFDVSVSIWDGFYASSDQYHNLTTRYEGFIVRENTPPVLYVPDSIHTYAYVPTTHTATAVDIDPDVLTFTWDWGDGAFSTVTYDTSADVAAEVTCEASHTWEGAGEYPVVVWVDDGEGHNVSQGITHCLVETAEWHEPILIDSDGAFTATNGVRGGSGTSEDPFLISGWFMNDDEVTGLCIQNTSSHFVVRNVHVFGNAPSGMSFQNASNGVVDLSSVMLAEIGVEVTDTDGLTINRCSFDDCVDGILIRNSERITVAETVFTACGLVLEGSSSQHFTTHTIGPDNTVDGRILYYASAEEGTAITSDDYGQIIITGCINVRISRQEFSGVDLPIQVAFSTDVIVEYCDVRGAEIAAGFVYCSEVTLTGLNLTNSTTGLRIIGCTDVTVSYCLMSDDTTAFSIVECTSAILHHNSLIGAADSVDISSSSELSFDDGYPSGGNYWSWNVGLDVFLGPEQDIPGSDGVLDAEYAIAVGMTDNYPLVAPCAYPPTQEPTVATAITVISPETTIELGEEIELRSYASDQYGMWFPVPSLTWLVVGSAGSLTVAEDQTDKAFLVGSAEGTCTVEVAYDDIVGSVTIEVIEGKITEILIGPADPEVAFGEELQFNAEVYNVYGIVPTDVVWSTDDGTYVSPAGLLFANEFPAALIEDGQFDYQLTLSASQSGSHNETVVPVMMDQGSDHDSDLTPDWWEVMYGFDPFNGSDTADDPDLDGSVNLDEYLAGTNPLDSDTDDDQLGDWFEMIFAGTDPTTWDSDNDGIGDSIEFSMSEGYIGEATTLGDGWIRMTIQWETYEMIIETNSSVLSGSFDKDLRQLSVGLSGVDGTIGATIIRIPTIMCNVSAVNITIDGEPVEWTIANESDYYVISLTYHHSEHLMTAGFLDTPDQEAPEDETDDGGGVTNLAYYALAVAAAAAVTVVILLIRMRTKKGAPPSNPNQ